MPRQTSQTPSHPVRRSRRIAGTLENPAGSTSAESQTFAMTSGSGNTAEGGAPINSYSLRLDDTTDILSFSADQYLTGPKNWHTWITRVRADLEYIGFDPTKVLETRHELWIKRKLLVSVSGDIVAQISHLKSGTEILAALEKAYDRNTITDGRQAYMDLQRLRYDPNHPDEFVNQFRALYNRIQTSNFKIHSEIIGESFILAAARKAKPWAARYRRTWDNISDPTPADFEAMYSDFAEEIRFDKLQSAYNINPNIGESSKTTGKAKQEPSEGKSVGKPRNKSNWYCLFCGRKGHDIKECRTRQRAIEEGKSGAPRYRMSNGTAVKKESANVTANTEPAEKSGATFSIATENRRWYESYAKKHLNSAQSTDTNDKASDSDPSTWWLFDTGADIHATNDSRDFIHHIDLPKNAPTISTGNGPVRPSKIGIVEIVLSSKGEPFRVTLRNCLYIQTLPVKIFSGEIFYKRGGYIVKNNLMRSDGTLITSLNINASGFYLHEHGRKIPLKGSAPGRETFPLHAGKTAALYEAFFEGRIDQTALCNQNVDIREDIPPESSVTESPEADEAPETSEAPRAGGTSEIGKIPEPENRPAAEKSRGSETPRETELTRNIRFTRLWHRRLGHPGFEALKKTIAMAKDIRLDPTRLVERPCDICDLTKSLRYRSQRHFPRATSVLQVLHMDSFVIKPTSIDGVTVGVYIIDDYSRYRWAVFGKGKGDLAPKIITLLKQVTAHAKLPIIGIHSDGGREFLRVFEWARSECITTETSAPYTPEENPIAERTVGIINAKAASLLRQHQLPQFLAPYAIQYAVAITNMSYTSANKDQSPHERFFDQIFPDQDNKPDLSPLRTIGCKVITNTSRYPPGSAVGKAKGRKFDPRAVEGKLAGWQPFTHNYYVYIPRMRSILRTPHVVFHESYIDEADSDQLPADIQDGEVEKSYPPWVEDIHRKGKSRFTASESVMPTESEHFPNGFNYDFIVPNPPTRECKCDHRLARSSGGASASSMANRSASVTSATVNRNAFQMTTLIDHENQSHGQTEGLPKLEFIDDVMIYGTVTEHDPKTPTQALTSPHAAEWRDAMDSEIKQLLDNGTFKFVNAPQQYALTGKWVFKEKRNLAGIVYRRKARVVARGFEQREGLDYTETFASTAAATSARILLAIAARERLALRCADAINAYLSGDPLKETIYMKLFAGLEDYFRRYPREAEKYGFSPGKVILLIKPLYGLKQAGRNWQQRLKRELMESGFRAATKDDAVYYNNGRDIFILSHVDDLYFIGKEGGIDNVITQLATQIKIEEADPRSYLGMRITSHPNGCISIDQTSHIDFMLGTEPMRTVGTPVTANAMAVALKNEKKSSEALTREYQRHIGQIIYPATRTRPDLSFAASLWARFMSNPSAEHLRELQRVSRYLKGRPNMGIYYNADPESRDTVMLLHGYADAAFDNQEGSRSTTGWVFFMNGGPISWTTKRQSVVAMSSTEAEYYALSSAAREAAWIRDLLEEIERPIDGPITVYEDNTASMKLADRTTNTNSHRTKHISRHRHYIRQEVENGHIKMEWVSTEHQVADGLTKPLEKPAFEKFLGQLGMKPVSEKSSTN